MLDSNIAGNVAKASVSYTNGGVITESGAVHVWGGSSWGGGFGGGQQNAREVTWSEGLSGVPSCYACEDLVSSKDHVVMVFKKKK